MENAEEVMQLLEDFSKVRPKDIPPELEHYLNYVAATGDPVFQWTLVKSLFREKLLSVITDFFESTLTVEPPPCPNVEPFNYERMKTCLIERLDTFTSAPFTVQRICELLTNPRKEYNRADKYMRAIEKNILVVSTREPGSGKRPLECDNSQQETIMNGMPDVKLNVSGSSLLHNPTDLPYLGAPPASNDVTIETTEANIILTGVRDNLDVSNCDEDSRPRSMAVQSDEVKPDQPMQESNREVKIGLPLPSSNDSEELLNVETAPNSVSAEDVRPTFDCDSNDKLSSLNDASSMPISSDSVSDKLEIEATCEISAGPSGLDLPDSLDSSDVLQNKTDELMQPCTTDLDCQETASMSDENEVSSSPAETSEDKPSYSVSDNLEEPSDSEAEATGTTEIGLECETSCKQHSVVTAETSDADRSDEAKIITITEVTATKSDDASLECDEITGTVVSPISPENSSLPQADENDIEPVHGLDENDLDDSHPDSSNDTCLKQCESVKLSLAVSETKILLDSSSEADSMSETKPTSVNVDSETSNTAPDQTVDEGLSLSTVKVSSPVIIESTEENIGSNLPMPSNIELSKESVVGEEQPSIGLPEEPIKVQEVETTADTQSEEMFDQDKREESVIHSTSLLESTIVNKEMLTNEEEISMDPNCEVEEAMDVDDTSNQMLVSEGENEGEPMDESEQVQS